MLFDSISHSLTVTFQKWESTVLQLHDNTLQDWQHGSDVQKEQYDWLREGGGMNGMKWIKHAELNVNALKIIICMYNKRHDGGGLSCLREQSVKA